MTSWLKWRLVGLFSVSALCSGGYWLQAQEQYPPPAKTPEAAGEMFFQLLAAGKKAANPSEPAFDWPAAFQFTGAISRAQLTDVSSRVQRGGPERLFAQMARQAEVPQFTGKVTGTQSNQTLVEVVPATPPKGREVVVVAEDGGYRVDLKATYGKWNNLTGTALDEAWFRYTGLLTPALRTSGNFLRSQCQSNMKQVMLGVLQYVQDYDEKLPRARAWQEGINPYLRAPQLYTCPSLPKGKSNGYAFNQHLSQFSQASIENYTLTVSFYETSNLMPNVFGKGTGRAYRHESGSNLAFADGHVKWFKSGNESWLTFNPDESVSMPPRDNRSRP